MEIIIIWLAFGFLFFLVWPWFNRLFRKSSDRLTITAIKEYLYDKIDFTSSYDIGSSFSRGDYVVNYQKIQINNFTKENLIISNHPLKGKSHEIVIEYLDGGIIIIKLDNVVIDSNLSPENYRAAHKILELGQRAFKGELIP